MVTDFSSGWSSALAGGADTIVARATPAGRGALAVIRLSGPESAAVAAVVCPDVSFEAGWRARLVDLFDAAGEPLDRGVVIPYPAPRSYTGEDMLEVTVHGSPFLAEAVIEAFLAAGARPALAGEFTRRAVVNGKLDLVQAEAVNDMIAADTAWQHRLAREQLDGALSTRFSELRSAMIAFLSLIEGSLDFAAHDVSIRREEFDAHRVRCGHLVRELLATTAVGERVREGLRVVILGPPNSGKSTLFNHFCGSERAIVSPQPGTTRDLLETELDFEGLRVILQDTAGLRDTGDAVEEEGHRRAVGAAASAAVVMLLWPVDDPDTSTPPDPPPGTPVVFLRSKSDLREHTGDDDNRWLPISCVTGEGLEELRARLKSVMMSEVANLGGEVAIARRHRARLESALNELVATEGAQPELAAENVRWALRSIEEMIGAVDSEEVLDEVFGSFCIGK